MVYTISANFFKRLIYSNQRVKNKFVGCLDFMLYQFCWLFNTKSIFMKIVLFQTIQFSLSTQFKCKYSLIVKNISISSYSV